MSPGQHPPPRPASPSPLPPVGPALHLLALTTGKCVLLPTMPVFPTPCRASEAMSRVYISILSILRLRTVPGLLYLPNKYGINEHHRPWHDGWHLCLLTFGSYTILMSPRSQCQKQKTKQNKRTPWNLMCQSYLEFLWGSGLFLKAEGNLERIFYDIQFLVRKNTNFVKTPC